MAVLSTLIGGLLGFFTFLIALIFFDTSFLYALVLYVGVGVGFALMALLTTYIWYTMANRSPPRRLIATCQTRLSPNSPAQKHLG
ncbi:hypothetical protein [Roseobacter sp.]|uniref:hypothetical protein n=1 Tax=Roseobacter sp. TaxID=1907202 RepID=UPI0032978E48